MVDDERFAQLRMQVRALAEGVRSDLAQAALLLAVADALDRWIALLAQPIWGEGAHFTQTHAMAADDASAELAQARRAARPLIDPALDAALDDAVAQPMRIVAQRASHFRGARELAVQPRAAPLAPPAAPCTVGAAAVDSARFGASAPRSTPPRSSFIARFVAYPQGGEAQARELLGLDSGTVEGSIGVGSARLAQGAAVEVQLSAVGLKIEGKARARQPFLWTGEAVVLNFGVETADLQEGAGTLLAFDARIDGLTIASVRLQLDIRAAPPPPPALAPGVAMARRAFASYSSQDRLRVLDRVAAVRLAAGLNVFLDCHDLNPGESWKPRLESEIDACDTFMLFWSDAAAQSIWVKWEWKRAIRTRGLERMQIHPLANDVRPPRELAGLHMGDPYIALMTAERLRRATTLPKENADA